MLLESNVTPVESKVDAVVNVTEPMAPVPETPVADTDTLPVDVVDTETLPIFPTIDGFGINRKVVKSKTGKENSTDVLHFDCLTRIEDADTFTNTVEVPFRFYPCLAAGLAYYIAIKKAPDRIQLLKAIYDEEFDRAQAEDRDRASFNVVPSLQYYRVG